MAVPASPHWADIVPDVPLVVPVEVEVAADGAGVTGRLLEAAATGASTRTLLTLFWLLFELDVVEAEAAESRTTVDFAGDVTADVVAGICDANPLVMVRTKLLTAFNVLIGIYGDERGKSSVTLGK